MAEHARLSPLLRAIALLVLVIALVAHASRPPSPVPATAPAMDFSAERAMIHVRAIAQRPHPIGSEDAARARAYVIAQLTALGIASEVQEATAVGTRYQEAGRVHNVIARMPGTHPGGPAVMLMAHTDGVPAGPAASDDGSGVAVLLETLRALRAGPPLAHDVIALFTDGEEAGLLGAAAFVREHRWAKDVAATLNFEARGTTGRAFMFETGPGNLDIVRVLAGAPDVAGTSLMVTVYRTLPNDTDLSELALLGKPALNFAFADGVERYHTTRDDTLQINAGSIQQEGGQALSVTRALANGPLPRPITGDAVFFDFPGIGIVYYPESASRPLAILIALLVAITLFVVLRRERRWLRDLILGVLATVLSTILGGGSAFLAGKMLTRVHSQLGGTPNFSGIYALALVLLALAVTSACWALARRWSSAAGAYAGALIVWAALALVVTWKLPGVSYLFVWPVIAASIATLLASRNDYIAAGSLWVATSVAMALLLPITYNVGAVLLGLTTGGGIVMCVLVPLLAWVIAPQVEAIAGAHRWRVTLAVLAAALVMFAVGAATVRPSIAHPTPSILVYAADADANDAWLVAPSELAKPGSWSASALGPARQILAPGRPTVAGGPPEWLASMFGHELPEEVRPVPRIALTGPVAKVIADSATAAGRRLTLRITTAPGTLELDMRSISGAVLSAAVDGRAIDTTRYRRRFPHWQLSYSAPPDSGIVLELKVPRDAKTTLELIAESVGIPPLAGVAIPPRPSAVVPVQTGDITVVHRLVTF